MTTEELIEQLKKYPGKKVTISDHRDCNLDENLTLGVAINHPSTYYYGQSWHWDGFGDIPGESVVVIY
jgi:hypothetical protein